MESKEIKKFLPKGGKVRSITGTKNGKKVVHYIQAMNPLGFNLETRQMALKVIYGENCEFAERGAGGNISQYYMSMSPMEWMKLFEKVANSSNNTL